MLVLVSVSASVSASVSSVFHVVHSASGCAGGFAAGASYFVALHEKDSPYPVRAVFNRDQEIGTECASGASIGVFPEVSRMMLLLPDESPASNPPPQPLLAWSSVVVSGAEAERLSLS
ncbi:MAG TPA: hypothetical protein ENN79_10780 [Desulfobacteraceae bacterium]|nr:hypothetical protein [Desulfobacteraceae bacterium]